MKNYLRGANKWALLLILSLSISSCKKALEVEPENVLDLGKAYQNLFDADAAIYGIYGKFQGIAEQYMILNELRGDLEDVTPNADKFLREINTHNVSVDNPWANPRPYFEIIMNCNDVIANFKVMLDNTRISQADYNIRVSEVQAIRCWVYLQAGIHFGSIPYITDPIANINDVKDESKFAKVSFAELLNRLTAAAEAMPNKNYIPAGTSLATTLDGYNTMRIFIHKNVLLGELNLWKGDYAQSAKYFHDALQDAEIIDPAGNSEDYYGRYKIGYDRLNGGSWGDMFFGSFGDRYSNYERMWVIPFDRNFAPKYPLVDLYSPSRNYLIKPSDLSIRNWDSEVQFNGSPTDANRGAFSSYIPSITAPYIYKFPNFGATANETGGLWILYRAATLHLHYSEAVNQLGYDRLAYALLNVGINRTFDPSNVNFNVRIGLNSSRNVSTFQQSDFPNVNSDFYFDGRNAEFPRFRSPWYRNTGIRQRAGLADARVDSAKFFAPFPSGVTNKAVIDRPGLTIAMENLLEKEGALELAYEGVRWPDLLRIALRRKTTEPNFLANKIAAKFEAKGDMATAGAIRAKFADEKNWFLPFKF